MADAAAARVDDLVGHDWGMAGMVGGAVLGAVAGAAFIAAVGLTGGLAAVAVAGAIGGGALSGGQLADGLRARFAPQSPTTGRLVQGSPNVFINGKPAVRAGPDFVDACTGLCMTHHLHKPGARVAEGSDYVAINGFPAARVGDRLECAAVITTGSPNVRIGGGTRGMLPITDHRATWTELATLVTYGAMGVGLVAAAVAGAAALATVGAATGGMLLLNEGLGVVGDRLGPGGRDILQGAVGLGTLLGGPKAARSARQRVTAARVRGNVAESQQARAASGYGGRAPAPGSRAPLTAAQQARVQRKLGESRARAVAVDRARVTRLSRAGDVEGARAVLAPHVRAKNSQALIDRLDVRSPRDRAVFWSGNKDAATAYADEIGGVALESTPGGRVVDGWDYLNKDHMPWDGGGKDFWQALSRKYSEGARGTVHVVQSEAAAVKGGGITWKEVELPALREAIKRGDVSEILPPRVVPNPPGR